MIRYRPFLNTDILGIVDIWRHQPPFHGQLSVVSRSVLDDQVFAKPYFDRQGLIVAVDDSANDQLVGFAHAGFGPDAQLSDLDTSIGIISQLQVIPGESSHEIGRGLLQHAIEYLKPRGAEKVQMGSVFPLSPFYLGLYGGSRIPGVMENDHFKRNLCLGFGFEVDSKVLVLERSLAGYRAAMAREQMMLRRKYQIKVIINPTESTWWDCCMMGISERNRFSVVRKTDREICGSVTYWDIQPLASEWGVTCRGLYNLNIKSDFRRCGLATFMVAESLRHLMLEKVGKVEAQVLEQDAASLGVFQKQGFETSTYGELMSKSV